MRINPFHVFELLVIQERLGVLLILHFDILCLIVEALKATNKITDILASKVAMTKRYLFCLCLNIRFIVWVDNFIYAKTAGDGFFDGFFRRVFRHLGSRSVLQWMILRTSLTIFILPFSTFCNNEVYPTRVFVLVPANCEANNFTAFCDFDFLVWLISKHLCY